MRAFKNLDYFRKIAPEHTKPTIIGGLISILSLSTILFLFWYELNQFYKPKILKDTYIANDPHDARTVSMNIDISFFGVPCFMIDMDVRSTISVAARGDINQNLFKSRLDSNFQPLDNNEPDYNNATVVEDIIKQAIDNNEICNIKGKIMLTKVTGQLTFTSESKKQYVNSLRQRYPDWGKELKMTHVINSLTFGDISNHNLIKKRFGTNNEHTQFDMMDLVDDLLYQNDKQVKEYFYFMKLVPHIFVDEINSETYSSYSYSLNHNSKAGYSKAGISMILDFAPINMKITKQSRDLIRFLINLCAIIGGVFVIFGLFNRSILSVKENVTGNPIR